MLNSQFEVALKHFQEVQIKHKKLGAFDTEPDAVFQRLMMDAMKGTEWTGVPATAKEWQLFDDMEGAEVAAQELAVAAIPCVSFAAQVGLAIGLITEACWRCR